MKPASKGPKIVKTPPAIKTYPTCTTEISKEAPILAEKAKIPACPKKIREVPIIDAQPA